MRNLVTSINEATMSTIELRQIVNEARKDFGEPEVRNSTFIIRVEDELAGELSVALYMQPTTGGTPQKYYDLTIEQCTLVGMRESKGVRRQVVAKLKEKEQPRQLSKAEMTLMVIGDLQNEVAQQAALIEQQKPAVDFAIRIASANKGVKLGSFAKAIGIGPNKIFEILREMRVLMAAGDRFNMPYQVYIDRGYFAVRQSPYEAKGETRISHTALITGKGERWLNGRLIEAGVLKAVAVEASE